MEVHFTSEQIAKLSEIAAHEGTDPEQLVREAALRILSDDARFRTAVQKGIAQADRGELIEEEEMNTRVKQMFNP